MTSVETQLSRALDQRGRSAGDFERDLAFVEQRARWLRRRSQARSFVVFAAVVGMAIGVTAVVVKSDAPNRQVTSGASAGEAVPFAAPQAPPGELPQLTLPGWTTASSSEYPSRWGSYLAVLRDPRQPVPGPAVRVIVFRAPTSYGGGRDRQQVDVNGHAATLSKGTVGNSAVYWHPTIDTTIAVTATGLDETTVLRVARGLVTEPDLTSATLTFIPDGLAPMDLDVDGPAIGAAYQFTRDGQTVTINLYPGAWQGFEDRISDAEHDLIPLDVHRGVGLFEDEGSTFRLWWLDGWWTWEIKGQTLPTREQLLTLLESIQAST